MKFDIASWLVTGFFTTCAMYVVVFKKVKNSGQEFKGLKFKFSLLVIAAWLVFAFYYANPQNAQLQWIILAAGISLIALIQVAFFVFPFRKRK